MKKIIDNIEVNFDLRGEDNGGDTLVVLLMAGDQISSSLIIF